MNTWNDGVLYTPRGNVIVYQCGSCRDYDDSDHWSFEWDYYRSCGHATEDEAKHAAEEHVIGIAQSMMHSAVWARVVRESEKKK